MDKWLTNLTIDELRAKILPEPHKPFEINGIPVFMNMDDNLLPGEKFKKHHEKPAEVSNFGRIRFNEKILFQRPDEDQSIPYGCLLVAIPNVSTYQAVCRLVAETWCRRPNLDYNTVHHISNNGTDNRPENLLWVTSEQYREIHLWLKSRQKTEGLQNNKDYTVKGRKRNIMLERKCSFCGKENNWLVGHIEKNVYICNDCVSVCSKIFLDVENDPVFKI
jgi:hypothetical protein